MTVSRWCFCHGGKEDHGPLMGHDQCRNILCLYVDRVLVSLLKDQPTSGVGDASVWKKFAVICLALLVQPPVHLYGQNSPSIFVRGCLIEPGQHLITVRELIFVETSDYADRQSIHNSVKTR